MSLYITKEVTIVLELLKGGKSDLIITLDRQKTYFPGDQIQARLNLKLEKELKIKQGLIALLCEIKSQIRSRRRSRHGTVEYKHWKTDTQVVGNLVFLEECVIPAGSNQSFEFKGLIPKDAHPTLDGEIIKVNWRVKATLNRKMAIDVNSETGIIVTSRLPAEINPQAVSQFDFKEYRHSSDPDHVDISFLLPRTDWALGETIDGHLVVQARKEFKLTDIRIELICTENVFADSGNICQGIERVILAEATKFDPGQTLTLPFKITVPKEGLPSINTSQCEITWSLKGILARRLAIDYYTNQALQVYSQID